jgi:hypothetical protein
MPYESIPNSPGPSLPGPDDAPGVDAGIQQSLGGDHTELLITSSQRMTMEDDAAEAVYAKDLTMADSAAVNANVVGDLVMTDSAVVMADVTGGAFLRDSTAAALVSQGPVDLQGGVAGIVFAPEFTVRDGGSVLMTQRDAVVFGAVLAGVLLVGWLLLRTLFGRR